MKESDIRPKDLVDHYWKLCQQEAESFVATSSTHLHCPACLNEDTQAAFEKWGFGYRQCARCGSIYQSPRPPLETFQNFYRDSQAVAFWTDKVFPAVIESRREKIFAPRVREIAALCANDGFSPSHIADVGAGFGVFLQESRLVFEGVKLTALEPNHEMAELCRGEGFNVLECFAEEAGNLDERPDLVVSFEVIEHVYDPEQFVRSLYNLVRPGGKVLLTGLCGDGFDLQVLREHSNQVSPPSHINFLSVSGITTLFERIGFEDARAWTPGKLDVDIVLNATQDRPDLLNQNEYVKFLLRQNEKVRSNFQKFLGENKLSSHLWVWAAKGK